jgi:hypothetical protein
MSRQPQSSVFLEKKTYRRRRMHDAARALPVLGLILLMLPLLWTASDGPATSNADATLYVFAVWCLLVLLAALVSRALRRDPPEK